VNGDSALIFPYSICALIIDVILSFSGITSK
jgi:hypothetical protein